MEIVGDREQDADQVVRFDRVALEHRREQSLGRVEHDLGIVVDHDDGTTGGTNLHDVFPPRRTAPRSDKATCRWPVARERDLLGRQLAERSRRQVPQLHGTDAQPHQPGHRQAHFGEQPPNLAFATLRHR